MIDRIAEFFGISVMLIYLFGWLLLFLAVIYFGFQAYQKKGFEEREN